jgi:hypothetical protein
MIGLKAAAAHRAAAGDDEKALAGMALRDPLRRAERDVLLARALLRLQKNYAFLGMLRLRSR